MVMAKKIKAKFTEPMLLRTDALPNDRERWQYELKMDGYRAIAFKTGTRECCADHRSSLRLPA
jgi:ATP-dependent DNA ligase